MRSRHPFLNTTLDSLLMFNPPLLLQNTHVQSLLASAGPRKYLAMRRSRELRAHEEEVILDCSNGIKLQGFYTPASFGCAPAQPDGKLAILIHGWLGGETSSYLLSAGATLYDQGYSVFRLNLRDHGTSHHLNKALFHSARIQEVLDAMGEIQRRFPHEKNYLAGFSLGGNFALRVAADYNRGTSRFDHITAICPVADPVNAMKTITNAMWIYPLYFVRKWKRTLAVKLEHFPELGFGEQLAAANNLQDLNAFFVPNHTPYAELNDYFNAYALVGDRLAAIDGPTHIIHSADDPVVKAEDLEKITPNKNLSMQITPHGGHCGFLKNVRLQSWVDDRLLELFQ